MTDREAIDVLFNELKCIDRNDGIHCDRKCESCDLVMDVGIIREAFNMAISALQAQDVPDTNVGDTVSRQAAIDALLEEVRLVDGYYVENDEVIDKDDAIEAIRLLPSAQPEPPEDICGECDAWNKYTSQKNKTGRWISCSERLPDNGRVVLWCNEHGSVFTSAITVRVGKSWAIGKKHRLSEIVAWMPLPEPYRAERRADEQN